NNEKSLQVTTLRILELSILLGAQRKESKHVCCTSHMTGKLLGYVRTASRAARRRDLCRSEALFDADLLKQATKLCYD
ncbi:hypothetical protein CEXT_120111, partial [Caerostris extrusa]